MTLYVVATPIGNLDDVSRRAAQVLGDVSCVLAEDTRRTRTLLSALGLGTRLRSYHDHSPPSVHAAILDELGAGASMAIVTDAGTPGVSDPGFTLVRDAAARGVEVVPIPGASVVTAFVSAAGLPCARFQFVGFAPRKFGPMDAAVSEWLTYPGLTVVLESANRVTSLLVSVARLAPSRAVVVARELTKLHEEWIRGAASSVLERVEAQGGVRGEVVVGITGEADPCDPGADLDLWLSDLLAAGVGTKRAAAILARRLGVSSAEAYRRGLELERGRE